MIRFLQSRIARFTAFAVLDLNSWCEANILVIAFSTLLGQLVAKFD